MGDLFTRFKSVVSEQKQLKVLLKTEGADFPGSDFETQDHKEWMDKLNLDRTKIKDIVWPGTHDSATNCIGIPFVSRPFFQCQNLNIYKQLVQGVRVFDIRVEKNSRVCHEILKTYHVRRVIDGIKRFLNETKSEFIILEIRTEYGHQDPADFDNYLIEQLGEHLIPQDDHVFDKTLRELLPKRVICIWKPRNAPAPGHGSQLWNAGHIKDDWTDTDLPYTKFQNNINHLQEHPPIHSRNYFYRVENTCTPQRDNPVVCVKPVTSRIKPYARLFISQLYKKGLLDRFQIFSSDFIDTDFINACIGLTRSRVGS